MYFDLHLRILTYFYFLFYLFYSIKTSIAPNNTGNYYYLICIIFLSYFINNTSFEWACLLFIDYITNLYNRSNTHDELEIFLKDFYTIF